MPATQEARRHDGRLVEDTLDPDALRDELFALHARFCQALGDPKRLLIITALRTDELSVGELARFVGARQANVSQHLALMRNLGLVCARRAQGSVYYRLADPRIGEAIDLLRAVQADLQRQHSRSLSAGGRPPAVDP